MAVTGHGTTLQHRPRCVGSLAFRAVAMLGKRGYEIVFHRKRSSFLDRGELEKSECDLRYSQTNQTKTVPPCRAFVMVVAEPGCLARQEKGMLSFVAYSLPKVNASPGKFLFCLSVQVHFRELLESNF